MEYLEFERILHEKISNDLSGINGRREEVEALATDVYLS